MATFNPGDISDSTACITVEANDDEDYEGFHNFTVNMETPIGPAVVDNGECKVVITDNEGK